MPRIPTQDGSRTRVPVAEMGAALPLARPSGLATAGANLATASESVGQVERMEAAAEARLMAAQDAIERARDEGIYTETLNARLRELEDTDDLSKPDTLRAFNQFVSEKEKEILGGHRGSEMSRAKLAAKVEAQRFSILGKAAIGASKARKALVQRSVDQRMGSYAAQAYDAPAMLGSLWQSWDGVIDDMAPALNPDEVNQFRTAGRQEIAKSTIQSLVDRGGFDEVDRMLRDTPGLAGALKPETLRAFQSAVTVARQKAQDEKQTAMFGGGAEGRALAIMTNDAASYAAGLLSPDQDRRFEAAVTHYSQPIQYLDPDSGKMVTRTPTLPPFVQAALRQRGRGGASSAPQAGGAAQPMAPRAQAAPVGPGAQQPTGTAQGGGQAPRGGGVADPNTTLWELADTGAGFVAGVATTVADIPGVGNIFSAREMTVSRTRIRNSVQKLVNVLRQNPRFSEGEREALAKEIDLAPGYGDVNAFKQRMIGVDAELSKRHDYYQEILEDRAGPSTAEERKHAREAVKAIRAFRKEMGVPEQAKQSVSSGGSQQGAPRVMTRAEALKLPPGTRFIDKDGIERVRP